MNDKFDQLAKGVARSVTRRQALKRFGLGLAAMALAGFGLSSKAHIRDCLAFGVPCQRGGGSSSDSCTKCCKGDFICSTDSNGVESCVCNGSPN